MSTRKELIEQTADVILNSEISRDDLIAKLSRLIELETRYCDECGRMMNIIHNCSNTKCFNYDP